MTTCPNGVQCVAVSTTVRPVTQAAETAVKSASIQLAPPGPCFDIGSMSSSQPTRLRTTKPVKMRLAGCCRSQSWMSPLRGTAWLARATSIRLPM